MKSRLDEYYIINDDMMMNALKNIAVKSMYSGFLIRVELIAVKEISLMGLKPRADDSHQCQAQNQSMSCYESLN